MKFKLLEAEGSNAQLYGAGNVCLLILSPVMIIWWKHTLPQAQDRQFYSLSSCGKGRSQPEEAVHYSWEQDEPHGQGRDVSIGQAWPCMLCEWALSELTYDHLLFCGLSLCLWKLSPSGCRSVSSPGLLCSPLLHCCLWLLVRLFASLQLSGIGSLGVLSLSSAPECCVCRSPQVLYRCFVTFRS